MTARAIRRYLITRFRRDLRYPIQAVINLGFMTFSAIALGFGASYTTGLENNIGLLANMAMILSLSTLSQTASGLTEENESIEEKLFLPIIPCCVITILALVGSLRAIVILAIMYSFTYGLNPDIFLVFALALLGGLSLGLLLYSLRLLLTRIEGFQTILTLAVFSLAFLPLHKAPDWLIYLPIVSVIQSIQSASVRSSGLVMISIQIIIFVMGLSFALWAEKEIIRRGIASDV